MCKITSTILMKLVNNVYLMINKKQNLSEIICYLNIALPCLFLNAFF